MKKQYFGFFTAFLLCSQLAWAQENTLTSVLVATYQNNPQLQQARNALLDVDESVSAAAANLRPQFNSSYNFRKDDNRGLANSVSESLTLSMTQTLWNGGRNFDAVDIAKLRVQAARAQLIESEQEILLSAITVFMDMRAAQAQFDLNANNIDVLQEQVRAANNRFEVGEITKTDVSLAQSRLAAARSSYENSRATLLATRANFAAIVGRDANVLANAPDLPKLPTTLQKALSLALANNPGIKAAQYNLQITELNMLLNKKNRLPSLTGTLSATEGRAGTEISNRFKNTSGNVRLDLTFSLPIYQGGLLASQRRQSAAQHKVRLAAFEQAKAVTKSQLQAVYARYKSAQESKSAVKERIHAAQIAYDGVSQEVQLGARTTLDVLNAEQELLTARAALVTAIRDEQVTAYQVLLGMGQLTAANLKLPVEIYNPNKNYQQVNPTNPLGEKRLEMFRKLKERR